jgi:hypothetical protein
VVGSWCRPGGRLRPRPADRGQTSQPPGRRPGGSWWWTEMATTMGRSVRRPAPCPHGGRTPGGTSRPMPLPTPHPLTRPEGLSGVLQGPGRRTGRRTPAAAVSLASRLGGPPDGGQSCGSTLFADLDRCMGCHPMTSRPPPNLAKALVWQRLSRRSAVPGPFPGHLRDPLLPLAGGWERGVRNSPSSTPTCFSLT